MTSTGQFSAALDKLAAAIDAAESAAAARGREAAAAVSAQKDSAAQEAALADLRRDHANLKAMTDDVARRIDGAIEQVEAILAGRV